MQSWSSAGSFPIQVYLYLYYYFSQLPIIRSIISFFKLLAIYSHWLPNLFALFFLKWISINFGFLLLSQELPCCRSILFSSCVESVIFQLNRISSVLQLHLRTPPISSTNSEVQSSTSFQFVLSCRKPWPLVEIYFRRITYYPNNLIDL